jgi:nitrogenase-associated protein
LAKVEFWEKPGCAGNARQKAVLVASGHTVIPRNLLAEPWTTATLLPFFAGKPVGEWFNRNAARIKSGGVRPDTLDAASGLALLLADPLLIRRPLMRVGKTHVSGFDTVDVAAWIGLTSAGEAVDESCQKRTGCHCPTPADGHADDVSPHTAPAAL